MGADGLRIDWRQPATVPDACQVDEVLVVVFVMARFGLSVTFEGSRDLHQAQRLASLRGTPDPSFDRFGDWHAEGAKVQQEGGHHLEIRIWRHHRADARTRREPLTGWSNQLVVGAERFFWRCERRGVDINHGNLLTLVNS